MPTDADPIIGNWYRASEKGQKFEVVAVDEDAGTVEVQHFDGDVEEFDVDRWYEMDVTPVEAPENWIGSLEEPYDDVTYSESDMQSEEWDEDLQESPPARRRDETGGWEEPE